MTIALRLTAAASFGINSAPLLADEEVAVILNHALNTTIPPQVLAEVSNGVALSLPNEIIDRESNATASTLMSLYDELCNVAAFLKTSDALDSPYAISEFYGLGWQHIINIGLTCVAAEDKTTLFRPKHKPTLQNQNLPIATASLLLGEADVDSLRTGSPLPSLLFEPSDDKVQQILRQHTTSLVGVGFTPCLL